MTGTNAQPKIRKESTTVKGRSYDRYVVDYGIVDTKRVRRTFKKKSDAEHFISNEAERQKILQKQIGQQAKRLSSDDLLDAARAIKLLKRRISLVAAAEYYVATHHDPEGEKRTVEELVTEYQEEGFTENLRPKSIQDRATRLKRFSDAYGDRLISQITRHDFDKWLNGEHTRCKNGNPCSAVSKRHYFTVTGGLFNFSVDKGYIDENPLTNRSRKRRPQNGFEDQSLPEILRPTDVEAVMRTAEEHEPSLVPALALGFFAGLRTAEITQLEWQDVNIPDGLITVSPRIAKKRRVRHIDIEPNLKPWLLPYRKSSGRIVPDETAWRYRFDKVRREAGILNRWPSNAMRHSFATYFLAKTGDQNRTALALGHRDTDVLFAHYRRLATKKEAEAFWRIEPTLASSPLKLTKTA